MAGEALLGTRAQKAWFLTIVAQAMVVFAMVTAAFGLVEKNVATSQSQFRTLPCYFALFGLAEIFELTIAFDALRLRNIVEIVGILCFHVTLIIFSALQVHQTKKALVFLPDSSCTSDLQYVGCSGSGTLWNIVEKLLIVVPVILAVSLLAMAAAAKFLFDEFGWVVFHVVGADIQLKRMYRWYQVMMVLLKLDFFLFTGLTMQLLILVLNAGSAEFIITIVAIPVVLFLLVGAGYAVTREIKWLMTISLILMLAAQSYFIFKFVRYFNPATRDAYATTRATVATFTIVAFLLLFATFAIGLRCFADFDKGLKQSKTNDQVSIAPAISKPDFDEPSSPHPGMGERHGSSYLGGASLRPRISID